MRVPVSVGLRPRLHAAAPLGPKRADSRFRPKGVDIQLGLKGAEIQLESKRVDSDAVGAGFRGWLGP